MQSEYQKTNSTVAVDILNNPLADVEGGCHHAVSDAYHQFSMWVCGSAALGSGSMGLSDTCSSRMHAHAKTLCHDTVKGIFTSIQRACEGGIDGLKYLEKP